MSSVLGVLRAFSAHARDAQRLCCPLVCSPFICFAFRLHGARRLHLRQEGARRAAAAAHRSTPQHSVRRAARAQVTQTRAGPRKTIDSSRIHPSRQGLFAAVAPKPLRPDEYPQETWRKKPPPPGAYDENGAHREPHQIPCTLCRVAC